MFHAAEFAWKAWARRVGNRRESEVGNKSKVTAVVPTAISSVAVGTTAANLIRLLPSGPGTQPGQQPVPAVKTHYLVGGVAGGGVVVGGVVINAPLAS
jgi:hypothetical protein